MHINKDDFKFVPPSQQASNQKKSKRDRISPDGQEAFLKFKPPAPLHRSQVYPPNTHPTSITLVNPVIQQRLGMFASAGTVHNQPHHIPARALSPYCQYDCKYRRR